LSDTSPQTTPQAPAIHESAEDWYEETEELPRRPRTRLLTPLTASLLLVLFAACGFIGGVLVQKQQTTTTAAGAAASGRLGASAGGATGASGAAGAASSAGGSGARARGLFGGGASGATIGTVSNINGGKLFVTTASGSMVEVVTTPQSKVTKSVAVGANSIHPGDSVVVSGITASNGTVTARTVNDSGAGSASGLSSLFGAGSSAATNTSRGGSSSLFGG
jgi:hypothetical protein